MIGAADVTEDRYTHHRNVDAAMGGRVEIHLATDGPPTRDRVAAEEVAEAAAGAAARAVSRIRAWARLLTRFDDSSQLSRLNRDPSPRPEVPPTLAAVLRWSQDAAELSDGMVDVTMLDERLAAEAGTEPEAGNRECSTLTVGRRGGTVSRTPGIRFDLDGVGKGWLADRALNMLGAYPGAIVDADGDLAIRVAPADRWDIGVADPRTADAYLAVFRLEAPAGDRPAMFGLATSGTSVHRWSHPVSGDGDVPEETSRHHLIDPRTRRPATTDVAQATVLATNARDAEALAKSAVILGTAAGVELLERRRVLGAVLLTSRGDVLALPRTLAYLA